MPNQNLKKELLNLIPKTAYHYDRVIILENDRSLQFQGACDAFREWLVENKIRHNVVYNLKQKSAEELDEVAKDCLDTLVVFETTGLRDSFRYLVEEFIELTNSGYRFRFLECSTYDFQFYVLPEELGEGCRSYHNLQCCGDSEITEWSLKEVKKR